VRLTVTDGRGGTVTDSRQVPVGSFTGTWSFRDVGNCTAADPTIPFTFTQTGNQITGGAFTSASNACGIAPGVTGTLDVSTPITIDSTGRLPNLIFHIPGRSDMTMLAPGMLQTPRRMTGVYLFPGINHSFELLKN
jgi:hypothetical protein